MSNLSVKNLKYLNSAIAALIALVSPIGAATVDSGKQNDVDFQIEADQRVYAPRSIMRLKFMVTNNSETPLLLYRLLSDCSGQEGFVRIEMTDQKSRRLNTERCAGDTWPPLQQVDVLKAISDPNIWIKLKVGEIHGGILDLKLPAKKGVYRLNAELMPPQFTNVQRETLARNGTRVLANIRSAPILEITVR